MLIDVTLNQVTTIIFVASVSSLLIGYGFGRRNTKELVTMGTSQGYTAGVKDYEQDLVSRGINIKSLLEGSENQGELANEYKAGF